MNDYENSQQYNPIQETNETVIEPQAKLGKPYAPVRFFLKLKKIFLAFGITAKILFSVLVVLVVWSGINLIKEGVSFFTYEVPAYGGSLHEGIIGYASFINPVLEYTDADKDMSSLIYSGLLRYSPSEEKYLGDLAESYEISDDLLTYTFTLRSNATFHDGKPVTADDVIFTIEKIKDPSVQSPLASNWIGVNVEKIDENQISFRLAKAYAPFIDNFTVGILPKHLWESVDPSIFARSTLNQEPVGSGPFSVIDFKKDQSGIYTEYTLQSFKEYTLGRPYIKTFKLSFYPKEEDAVNALNKGDIESIGGIEASTLKTVTENSTFDSYSKVIKNNLPYSYTISFNQNTSKLFLSKEVRKALSQAVDRSIISEEILFGLGTPTNSPFVKNSKTATTSTLAIAEQTLVKAGWKKNAGGIFEKTIEDMKTKKKTTETLSFTISTSDLGDLKKIAEKVVDSWKQLGADVTLQVFDDTDFVKTILRPRKFESMLYGYATNRIPDFYPFWHSSQRNDPGLNTSQYTNAKVDKFLERLRLATSTDEQVKILGSIDSEFQNDVPAIVIISPQYAYILPKNLQGFDTSMVLPKDRFLNIYKWYRSTTRAFKINK